MKLSPFYFSNATELNGKVRFVHNEEYNTRSAFEKVERAFVAVELPREIGVTSLELMLFTEDLCKCVATVSAEWTDCYSGVDTYLCPIDLSSLELGLYLFKVVITCSSGLIYGYKNGTKLVFSEKDSYDNLFQLLIYKNNRKLKNNSFGGVIYHIFVDRFNKGGRKTVKAGEAYPESFDYIPEFPPYPGAPLKNNTLYGGTLDGIREKLPYISSLGVTDIYLSPIFESVSNHKYDTADYLRVDPTFGGEEAFVDLINDARAYGIGIILDGVFNHTGADSIYFNKFNNYNSVGAYQSQSSKYYEWFDFKSHPDDYTCWWGIEILPRINPDKPSCREFFVGEGGVIDKYSKLGIHGFRLDVADELSDDFISSIKARLVKNNPDAVLYGEVWEDASNKIAYGVRKRYYLGRELDGVMNYPVRTGIIDYIKNRKVDTLEYALTDIIDNAPECVANMQMNLLGTHDTERIITVLGADSSSGKENSVLQKLKMSNAERENAIKKVKNAFTVLFTIPGIPSIFYGDEAGLEGYSDPFNRLPFPWGREERELVCHISSLGNLRKYKVYKNGKFKLLHLSPELLVFQRYDARSNYVTIINNSDSEISLCYSGKIKKMVGDIVTTKKDIKLPPETGAVVKFGSEFDINVCL